MPNTIEFDASTYSERALRLILARAQVWQCTPGEAVARLLDHLAQRTLRRIEAHLEKNEHNPTTAALNT